MSESLCRFSEQYRGRHHPADAYWWLTHPDSPGPSGAAPPQQVFLDAADELFRGGCDRAAQALLEAAAELLLRDRRAALNALEEAQQN